jgi:uncharacterized membrane protein YgcG
MKPKSALFVSAALTAFVLAILASVVSAFSTAKTSEVTTTVSPTQEVAIAAVPTQPDPTATQPTQVGPEQAASIAAQFMNKTDVYSVESSSINSVNAYKVVFSSGDIVYVGLDGKVISTAKLQPAVVNIDPTPAPKKHRSSSGGGSSGGSNGGGSGGGGDDGGDGGGGGDD